MAYDNASEHDLEEEGNEEMDDPEGMDDPVILRGLLQCISIAAFFTLRYVLDVLLTVPAVQALSFRLLIVVRWGWNGACCFPAASLALLYLCGSRDSGVMGFVARMTLRTCILRSVFTTVLDDSVVVFSLKKRHIWVPLGWLVTFTRVSSGRMAPPQGAWQGAHHHFLCHAMPWVLRVGLFWATWSTSTPESPIMYEPLRAPPSHFQPSHTRSAAFRMHAQEQPPEKCASYTGFPIPCDELERVHDFNSRVMPTMRDAHYRVIRKAITDRGLAAHVWHVGHAIPDPSKSSTQNKEDYGWNLFAQHAVDNLKLGHCLVSCAEAHHVGAHHVQCSTSTQCTQTPSTSWW